MNCVCLNLNTSKSRVPSSTVCTLHTYVMHEFRQSCLKLNMLKHIPNIKKTVAFDELANMFCKNLRLLESFGDSFNTELLNSEDYSSI